MKKSRIIAALLFVILFVSLGAVQAGELVFKRNSCRDHITNVTMFPMIKNSGVSTSSSVIIQVTSPII